MLYILITFLISALFGAYGSGNPMASGRSSYGGSGTNTSVANSAAAYGNTLSVAASQAASLGINPASEYAVDFVVKYLTN